MHGINWLSLKPKITELSHGAEKHEWLYQPQQHVQVWIQSQLPTSARTSLINCSALAICSGVPISSTILVGELGSASISRVTWIFAPDWSWRYLIVSPPLPMITPTLPWGISIFLLEPEPPRYEPYETGIDEGAEFDMVDFISVVNQRS